MSLAHILSKDGLKQSTHRSMMLSVFTSCVVRTRTLGNQSFHFQSIFTTTMNVDLPTPLTCSMMMDSNNQPIHLQYHLAPNFTSHIMRTRSLRKLRSFFSLFIYL